MPVTLDLQPLADYAARVTAVLDGYARALPGAEAGEMLLENEWARSLNPALAAMYMLPLRNGLQGVWGNGREQIRRWVLRYYQDEQPGLLVDLENTLRPYHVRSYNLGGQTALRELDLLGRFEIEDERILESIYAVPERLASPRSRMSLPRTTAAELARAADAQHKEGVSWGDALDAISGFVLLRTAVRSAVVAMNENVRMSRWGLAAAAVGNGVKTLEHVCESDVWDKCATGQCPPLCGNQYDLGGVFSPLARIPATAVIPLHVGCRCYYKPIKEGWLKPALIWTGFALGD